MAGVRCERSWRHDANFTQSWYGFFTRSLGGADTDFIQVPEEVRRVLVDAVGPARSNPGDDAAYLIRRLVVWV